MQGGDDNQYNQTKNGGFQRARRLKRRASIQTNKDADSFVILLRFYFLLLRRLLLLHKWEVRLLYLPRCNHAAKYQAVF